MMFFKPIYPHLIRLQQAEAAATRCYRGWRAAPVRGSSSVSRPISRWVTIMCPEWVFAFDEFVRWGSDPTIRSSLVSRNGSVESFQGLGPLDGHAAPCEQAGSGCRTIVVSLVSSLVSISTEERAVCLGG